MKTSMYSRALALSLALVASSFVVARESEKEHHNNHVIRQKDLPVTISKSGKYTVECNLKYAGPGAAVTITEATNVRLDFDNHNLTLYNPAATGILVQNSSEVTIENNDVIRNIGTGTKTGSGIHFVNTLNGNANGLFLEGNGFGVLVETSSTIAVRDTVFTDNGIGVKFAGSGAAGQGNTDSRVIGSSFANSTGETNLLAQQIDGLLIDGSTFTSTGSEATENLAQFGDTEQAGQTANNLIVRNSTFINKSSNKNLEGIFLLNGAGALIDSVLVDIDNTGAGLDTDFSGIHISGPAEEPGELGGVFVNATVRNSTFQGPAINGMYPDEGANALIIENNLATGAQKHGIFLAGTTNSTAKDNTAVSNGTAATEGSPAIGSGIFVGEESNSNAVYNNVTSGNKRSGIEIEAGSTNNLIQNNRSFSNGAFDANGVATAGFGIRDNEEPSSDNSTGNQVWNNTAYNNFANYSIASVTVNPIVVNKPGCPAVTGENIDAAIPLCAA
jgi:parallel beta-helix repeat protein